MRHSMRSRCSSEAEVSSRSSRSGSRRPWEKSWPLRSNLLRAGAWKLWERKARSAGTREQKANSKLSNGAWRTHQRIWRRLPESREDPRLSSRRLGSIPSCPARQRIPMADSGVRRRTST
ncbi:hypothetical protein Nmel_001623, partial [Mimus melanotis]